MQDLDYEKARIDLEIHENLSNIWL